MESIAIEIRENDHCPPGMDVFQNQRCFSVCLNPKGGVGDFEIMNSKGEIIVTVQKHLSTISLLENMSRSEIITVDLTNNKDMIISCPPSNEISAIINAEMGLCSSNTMEIRSKNAESKQYSFKLQKWNPLPKTQANSQDTNETEQQTRQYEYQIVDDKSVVVAQLASSRTAPTVHVNLLEELSPVQIAIIFAAMSFQIYSFKKQKGQFALLTIGSVLVLIILIVIVYVSIT